ncbi:MAG: hypothetical protein GF308_18555 [Candidatus Heimdallarchaeota archaeon]|nr:hypothetical protein [Candidatus Heimdallarchaeota archaeon]
MPENEKILIDSTISRIPPKTQTIVSHAHSDHFSALNSYSPTLATKETIDLYTIQKGNRIKGKYRSVQLGEKITIETTLGIVTITFVPSGHVLGSASILIEFDNERLLFSSDIGAKGILTVNHSLKPVKADHLIVEATFGSPRARFPPRQEIAMDILRWTADIAKEKMIAVFSAGKIGSAQELIKLFNDYTNLRVLTHGSVTPVSEVHKKYGIDLEFFDSRSEEGREILREGDAVVIQQRGKKIVPFFMKEYYKCKRAIVTGMVTKYPFKTFDAAFPLSSHANYYEILDYIEQVSPAKVFTIYGDEDELAKNIYKKFGISAKPIKQKIVHELEVLLPLQESDSSSSPTTSSSVAAPSSKVPLQSNPTTIPPITTKKGHSKNNEKKDLTLDDFLPIVDQ